MMLPEDNGLLLDWLMYAFEAQLYLLGMLIMKASPEELSVCFIAFLLAVPLLFVMPPVQHISNILFFAVIFIGLALHVETRRIAVIDTIDCVVFGMVSSIHFQLYDGLHAPEFPVRAPAAPVCQL